jgi:3-oxoadipate enol-lactonase
MALVSLPKVGLFTRIDGADQALAPWIVLSNSLAADHSMWDPQIASLSRRYRVLRYDTRGHGASGAPPGPYDLGMLVEDVIGLLDHYEIASATFMGLSLGGMTGLGLALAHPDRVSRLVCCDARADSPEAFVRGWDERIALVEAHGMQGVLAGTIERWLVPAFRTEHPNAVAKVEAMILRTSPQGYIGCAAALKQLDYLKGLPRLEPPSLFVGGAQDAATPPQVMQKMAEAVTGAQFTVVPNAAHLSNIDNAPAFNEAVGGFLGLEA